MRPLVIMVTLVAAGCATPSETRKAQLARESCQEAYARLLKKSDIYVGYGTGVDPASAFEFAQTALAQQISVQVSSETTLEESDVESTLSSLSEVTASADLFGVQVEKRCFSQFGHEVVASMKRASFMRTLRTRIDEQLKRAKGISQAIDKASTRAQKLTHLFEGEQFLETYDEQVRKDGLICIAAGGCLRVSLQPLDTLKVRVDEGFSLNQFAFVPADPLAEELAPKLIAFLQREGVTVTEGGNDGGEAVASCSTTSFPQMDDTNYQISEVTCKLNCQLDRESVMSFELAAKGVGENRQAALQAAKSRL